MMRDGFVQRTYDQNGAIGVQSPFRSNVDDRSITMLEQADSLIRSALLSRVGR